MTRKLVFISDSELADSSSSASTSSISISDSSQSSFSNSYIDNKSYSIPENSENSYKISKNNIVTSFNELQDLKPRSRQPIDIFNCKNEIKSSRKSIPIRETQKPVDYEIIKQLKVLSSPQKEDRKYFSFMSTNKNIKDIERRSLENHPKLKIINNELVNTLDNFVKSDKKKINSRYSSSSSSASSEIGSDSGCGSSIIARSSFSEKNEFLPITKQNISNESYREEKNRMKNLCEKIFSKKKFPNRNSNLDQSINDKKVKKREITKVLTILFDYETSCKSYNGQKSSFSVKKGERVKVLRNYEKDYLVATFTDNRIGFVPKDFTVDLEEVENRWKQQKSIQKFGYSVYNSNHCYMSIQDDYENLQLTHC